MFFGIPQAMNNIANTEARDAPAPRGPTSHGSVRSNAESAADKALDRIADIRSKRKGSDWDGSSNAGERDNVPKLEAVVAAQALLRLVLVALILC